MGDPTWDEFKQESYKHAIESMCCWAAKNGAVRIVPVYVEHALKWKKPCLDFCPECGRPLD